MNGRIDSSTGQVGTSVSTENPVSLAAAELTAAGFAVCKLRPGEKRPTYSGWTTGTKRPDEFGPTDGIGIITGWLSNTGRANHSLASVDMDSEAAVANADEHLPPTSMIDGRPGNPRSHRWYLIPNESIPTDQVGPANPSSDSALTAAALGVHPGPRKVNWKHGDGSNAIDFLASGQQAAVPPTLHESGERREWQGGVRGEPTVIAYPELIAAVESLAAAIGATRASVQKPRKDRSGKAGGTKPVEMETVAYTDETGTAKPLYDAPRLYLEAKQGDVRIGSRAYTPVERLERYLRYLAAIPVDRVNGENNFYRSLRLAMNDFLVRDESTIRETVIPAINAVLATINAELWADERQLAHKIDDAGAYLADEGYEPGCKLDGEPPMAWDNSARLADEFLAANDWRFLRDSPFEYAEGVYRLLDVQSANSTVHGFAEQQALAEYVRLNERLAVIVRQLAGEDVQSEQGEAKATDLERERKRLAKLAALVPKVTTIMVRETTAALRARRQLPSETSLNAWLDELSRSPVLAVANGLLDPVTRTLMPHDPRWFSTTKLDIAFDPAARCPRWLAFLSEIMEGDGERVAVLQELFGSCLDVSQPAKWFGMLVGGGDNGKSVVLNVLRFLLGTANISAVTLDALLRSNHASFGIFGKLANIVGDQGYMESKCEAWLKTLTGGDLIAFDQKHRDIIFAESRTKLLISANDPPTFSDKSDALWNRLVAIPFNYVVPAEHKNPALLTLEHWRDELAGILNWALDGLQRYRAKGFSKSAKCDALKERHRQTSDPARAFLVEHYEYVGGDSFTATPTIYLAYLQWIAANGYDRKLTSNRFGMAIASAFPNAKDGRGRVHGKQFRGWHGLRETAVTVETEGESGTVSPSPAPQPPLPKCVVAAIGLG